MQSKGNSTRRVVVIVRAILNRDSWLKYNTNTIALTASYDIGEKNVQSFVLFVWTNIFFEIETELPTTRRRLDGQRS